MGKQEVGRNTGGDRLHACEVTRQLVRSCYNINPKYRDKFSNTYRVTYMLYKWKLLAIFKLKSVIKKKSKSQTKHLF